MIRDRLIAKLCRSTRGRRGDHDLNPGWPPANGQDLGNLRHAAVLVLIIDRPEGLTVLFTRRTEHLVHHPGQISFPGGRVEREDASLEDTALRETEEEIGLGRELVEIIGRLDTYITRTGFEITPYVGMATPPLVLIPDPQEVAEIFEVPLAFLCDPENRERHSREVFGRTRNFYALPYGDYYIWGATAGMLVNLAMRLGGEAS
jgi:8-oxo-dGTP pyrophosphatase MutT (NUDIX family)